MLLPQGGDEPLHGLVLDRDLINVQIHVIPQPQLLQLLKKKNKHQQSKIETVRQEVSRGFTPGRFNGKSEGLIAVYTGLYELVNSTWSGFTATTVRKKTQQNPIMGTTKASLHLCEEFHPQNRLCGSDVCATKKSTFN